MFPPGSLDSSDMGIHQSSNIRCQEICRDKGYVLAATKGKSVNLISVVWRVCPVHGSWDDCLEDRWRLLSYIITLEEDISTIFDRSFLKIGTLMLGLLDVGLLATSVKNRQYQHFDFSANIRVPNLKKLWSKILVGRDWETFSRVIIKLRGGNVNVGWKMNTDSIRGNRNSKTKMTP